MNAHRIKQLLWQHCLTYAEMRINTAQQAMVRAQLAANEEDKSSAGDKYETGRAMMQLERDQAAQQLAEANKLKAALDTVSLLQNSIAVSVGSAVISKEVSFYIAISAGTIAIDAHEFITLSPSAPLAKSIVGLKRGDVFSFKNKQHTIEAVY
jgi:transcription elongation GreA/GreB family factor